MIKISIVKTIIRKIGFLIFSASMIAPFSANLNTNEKNIDTQSLGKKCFRNKVVLNEDKSESVPAEFIDLSSFDGVIIISDTGSSPKNIWENGNEKRRS